MWLFWFAIFILFILVSLGSLREGITSPQTYELRKYMAATGSTPEDKIANIIALDIQDYEVVDILNSSLDPEEKINNIKIFLSNLVDKRNNDPDSIYLNTPDKISSDKFFKLLDILNSDNIDDDRILLINDLNIQESTFNDIIDNNAISNSVKLFGDPEAVYTGPSISAIVNQTLFSQFDQPIVFTPPSNNSDKKKSGKK